MPYVKRLPDQSGMALFLVLELILALGLLATFAFSNLFNPESRMISIANYQMSAKAVQGNMVQLLSNPQSWNATINDTRNGSSFSCIVSGTPCAPRFRSISVIVDASHHDGFNAMASGSQAFRPDGSACGVGATDPACSITLALQWAPDCASACRPSKFKLRFDFSVVQNAAFTLPLTLQGADQDIEFTPEDLP